MEDKIMQLNYKRLTNKVLFNIKNAYAKEPSVACIKRERSLETDIYAYFILWEVSEEGKASRKCIQLDKLSKTTREM